VTYAQRYLIGLTVVADGAGFAFVAAFGGGLTMGMRVAASVMLLNYLVRWTRFRIRLWRYVQFIKSFRH
jgi:hypothetical protein